MVKKAQKPSRCPFRPALPQSAKPLFTDCLNMPGPIAIWPIRVTRRRVTSLCCAVTFLPYRKRKKSPIGWAHVATGWIFVWPGNSP